MEEVWTSSPNWIKPVTKDEKKQNRGLENNSEKQDNRIWISCLAFLILIGCFPVWAKVKLTLSLAYHRPTAFLIIISKSAKLQ